MARISLVAACVASMTACGGQTTGGGAVADAAAGTEASSRDSAGAPPPGHTKFLFVMQASPGGCLPEALTTDASGQVACTIYLLPASASACDASRGLAPVTVSDAAAVRSHGQASATQLVCQLAQLPQTDWVNGSCVGSTQAGWCYVSGADAGGGCSQAIDFSASGTPQAGDEVLLGCD